MAEYSGLYNATNGSPEYTAADLGRFFSLLAEGVAYGYGNELEATKGAGLQAIVDSGGIVSKGWFYIQDEEKDGASPKILSIDAATAGYNRYDLVVVEFDTDNATAIVKVVKGNETTGTPALPNLTDTATKWQVAIGKCDITGSVLNSVSDERTIGNGRTNPNFQENVTAPNLSTTDEINTAMAAKANLSGASFTGNVTAPSVIADNAGVKDGGKVYLNTAKTAYLRYTTNALYLKLPSCTEVQIPGVVVGTSSSAPAGTYPVNTMYLERDA